MSPRKAVTLAAAVAALVLGQAATASASAAPATSTASSAPRVQHMLDTYLAQHPEAHRTGTDTLSIPGGTLTVAPQGTKSGTRAISCADKHLCIQDGRGYRYDYYRCGTYSFNGIGDGVFNNNQTPGTVARFYNSDRTLRWTNRAKSTGTASWTPVFYVQPC